MSSKINDVKRWEMALNITAQARIESGQPRISLTADLLSLYGDNAKEKNGQRLLTLSGSMYGTVERDLNIRGIDPLSFPTVFWQSGDGQFYNQDETMRLLVRHSWYYGSRVEVTANDLMDTPTAAGLRLVCKAQEFAQDTFSSKIYTDKRLFPLLQRDCAYHLDTWTRLLLGFHLLGVKLVRPINYSNYVDIAPYHSADWVLNSWDTSAMIRSLAPEQVLELAPNATA